MHKARESSWKKVRRSPGGSVPYPWGGVKRGKGHPAPSKHPQCIAKRNCFLEQEQEEIPYGQSPFIFSMFPSVDMLFADQHLHDISAGPNPKDLVVIFVDSNYLETFGIWLNFYKRHDNSRRILCIFSVSDHVYDKMAQLFSSPEMSDKMVNIGETLLVNVR
eukprot:scaffold3257_cov23-Cyclotella_meneghiniana.AAC.1